MPFRVVRSEAERKAFLTYAEKTKLPFTADIQSGRRRTVEQNRLQFALLKEIAEQIGESAEDVRAYCKLTIGIPILRAEDAAFAERYDAVVRGLPYQTKLSLMKEPFDFPVTRLMNTEQKTRYLDSVMQHYAEQGVAFSVVSNS